MIGLVVLRVYVALAIFQPFRDLEAGDNQSLKFKWLGVFIMKKGCKEFVMHLLCKSLGHLVL